MLLYLPWNGQNLKDWQYLVLVRMWNNWNYHTLWVRMQNGTAILENVWHTYHLAIPLITICPEKWKHTATQFLYVNVHSHSIMINDWEKKSKCPWTCEWIKYITSTQWNTIQQTNEKDNATCNNMHESQKQFKNKLLTAARQKKWNYSVMSYSLQPCGL